MPENSSCLEPKPMIKLGNCEKPSVLYFNLPQTTCFVANVNLTVPINEAKFKISYKSLPKICCNYVPHPNPKLL